MTFDCGCEIVFNEQHVHSVLLHLQLELTSLVRVLLWFEIAAKCGTLDYPDKDL